MIELYSYSWPENIYSRRYLSLINKAANGRWLSYKGYVERHHIVPVSFGGGKGKENIVVLPGRFHYSAHYWLMKCFASNTREGRSMIAAFRKMNLARSYQERPMKPRLYEEMRQRAAKSGTGRTISPENKAKLQAAKKALGVSEKTRALLSAARRGKPLSEKHRKNIGLAHQGRKDSNQTKEKRAAYHRGAKRSEETRQKMRDGRKNAKQLRVSHQTITLDFIDPSEPNT